MSSHKVVFFMPPDFEGCHLLKALFQDNYGMCLGSDEHLVLDYISHKIDVTSMDLKLYVVPDLEKYKKLRPLYFQNVGTFVVVFDVAKGSVATWEKIYQVLRFHHSNSKMVFLGYKKDGDTVHVEISDFIGSHKGMFLEFSGRLDLEQNIELLFESLDG